ncbi:type IV secretion system protein (plasmid) [Sinorhizobium medicae]|uniref:type IV secretion system protein n=1 Tax=Sinorhizobium medicae TaxID=110321 RepID=UPI002AF6B845|nr:type IV secretion system protein [Sinorhizobium medicae]WQO48389.1 type IV secretion system protein [Sinorhizobium medicae]WQO68803.1 type IV secretion system protein [Sinorhizobium medicae]WQO75842.1 type IV secretion system protein [Sinorhizobium medicae]WQO95000.1 type IV secretion system protein [Sinorhizobium medicae]
MAATTIISDIFEKLDNIGETFISNAYEGLALQVTVLFGSMLTLYVIWWGYMILAGRDGFSVPEAAWRLGRAFFIYYMATNWDAFSATLYQLVQAVPNLVSDTIIESIAGSGGILDGGTDDTTGVVKILDAVFETAGKVYEQVATGTFEYVGALIGAVVFVVAMIFIAVAAAAILAAKLMLFITLALAPVFIILALYRWTFRFTDGWLLLMVNLMVTQTLMMSFLAFLYQLIELAINTANNTATESKLSYVAPFVVVCLLGIVVFRFIPSFAAAIVGGTMLGQGDTAFIGGRRSLALAERQVSGRARILRSGLQSRRSSTDVQAARARAIQRETEKNGQL